MPKRSCESAHAPRRGSSRALCEQCADDHESDSWCERAVMHDYLSDDLRLVRNPLLIRAPARVDAVGRAVEHGFDAAYLAVFDLEELAELPGPVDLLVIEEAEREHDAAL